MSGPAKRISPTLVALAGWLVPGLGYWLLGERARGMIVGITIISLFVLGILFAGIRVIEVPGFDEAGMKVHVDQQGRRFQRHDRDYETGSWALTGGGLIAEIANKPWYIPQIIAGPITLVTSVLSVAAAQAGVSRVHARLMDIGVLYTAIAGMLNLLAIIDSSYRAAHREG